MRKRILILALPISLALIAALDLTGRATPVTSAMAPGATSAYSLTWSTIDNGGGTSTGGSYSLSGTIGQPDAGTLSGDAYALGGGFWTNLLASLGGTSIYLPLVLR